MAATSWPGIFVSDDTAYVSYNSHVYAIDVEGGNEIWRYPAEAERNLTFFARPALTQDGQLIVGDYDKALHSLDPETGQENVNTGGWPYDGATNRFIGGALTTSTGIFAPSADGNLYALDFDGSPLWGPFSTGEPQWATPTTDGKRIYLPSMDHTLYALDPQTGRQVWAKDLGGAIVGTPALSEEGVLYVGTFANQILALSIERGDILWQEDTGGWVWSGPAIDGDRIYFGDLSGKVYARDRKTGALLWEFEAGGPVTGTPLATEESIYLTTESGSLIALTKEGSPRWRQELEVQLYGSLFIAGDLILIPAVGNDTVIFAYNQNGNQAWAFAPGS